MSAEMIIVRWIFQFYLGALILFGREWTIISVGPVYTTDIALIVMWLYVIVLLLMRGGARKLPLMIHMWAILGVAILQLLHGIVIYDDIKMSLRQFAPFLYLTFAWVVFNLYSNVDRIRQLLKFIFYCSILSGAARISGIAFNEISFGHYSLWGLSIFIGINFYYSAINRMEKRFIAIGISLNLFELFSVPVRGAWISLFLAIFFCIFLWLKSKNKITMGLIRNTVFGFLVSMGIIIAAAMVNPDFEDRIASIFNLGQSLSGRGDSLAEANTAWRYLVWQDMFNAWLQKPIFGYGFGDKFMPVTIVALGWGTGESDFLDPHNSHLHFLYMLGLIGFLVFELFFIRLIIRYLKVLRQSAVSESSKMLILSLLGAIIYIVLLANFEVVFESPYMIVYMWVVLGLLFSVEKNVLPQR